TSLERKLPFSTDKQLRRKYMILDEDIPGNIRWGRILEKLDKLAEDIALDYVQQFTEDDRVVTAAVVDIAMHVPGDIHKDLFMRACINYVATSSMVIGIRVDEGRDGPDARAA